MPPHLLPVNRSRVPDNALFLFFLSATPPAEIYTLSLHDALPISQHLDGRADAVRAVPVGVDEHAPRRRGGLHQDRKSTRLNSSHANISYAVFCLKKKKSETRMDESHEGAVTLTLTVELRTDRCQC